MQNNDCLQLQLLDSGLLLKAQVNIGNYLRNPSSILDLDSLSISAMISKLISIIHRFSKVCMTDSQISLKYKLNAIRHSDTSSSIIFPRDSRSYGLSNEQHIKNFWK